MPDALHSCLTPYRPVHASRSPTMQVVSPRFIHPVDIVIPQQALILSPVPLPGVRGRSTGRSVRYPDVFPNTSLAATCHTMLVYPVDVALRCHLIRLLPRVTPIHLFRLLPHTLLFYPFLTYPLLISTMGRRCCSILRTTATTLPPNTRQLCVHEFDDSAVIFYAPSSSISLFAFVLLSFVLVRVSWQVVTLIYSSICYPSLDCSLQRIGTRQLSGQSWLSRLMSTNYRHLILYFPTPDLGHRLRITTAQFRG